jgi:peroxiredoxin
LQLFQQGFQLTLLPILIISVLIVALALWTLRDKFRGKPVPDRLRPGNSLPAFTAVDENGNLLESASLRGSAAVLLFVRGSWCPFCSKQVANLTKFYKEITDSGARLILITPRPLETTRRVADMFGVEFEFWLDESLAIAKCLGLVQEAGVPDEYREVYGDDTLWPTTLVIDASGLIRHTELSRFIADRPNPEKLLTIVKKL